MNPFHTTNTVTIHHGDCLDIIRELPDESVDAVVTDPPYNLSFMAKPWDAYSGQEDAGFCYWLAGLIDGEGHFAIKRHTRETYAPMFGLKLRADERGTLETIRRRTGIGTLTDERRADGNDMVRWNVQSRDDCQRLVDLLDKYPLRAKKLADYWTWREAVCEWTDRPRGNRWAGAADNTRMAELRERLMSGRAYSQIPWSGNEFQDWCRLWAAECLRILKPGGHMLAFGGSRTWHRLAAAVEDAGFEIRDSIAWLYGSGFPKSLNVAKAIATGGGRPEDIRRAAMGDDCQPSGRGRVNYDHGAGSAMNGTSTSVPLTADAEQWQGWGTALKPAFEPIVVARKPLAGTVAANVVAHGTGALNIDGCRIEAAGGDYSHPGNDNRTPGGGIYGTSARRGKQVEPHPAGRWPANVVLDDTQAAELDRQSGTTVSRVGTPRGAASGDAWGMTATGAEYSDQGGASRFFPTFKYQAKAPTRERPKVDGVAHPTVKPLELMRWLVRLVTPPGGLVLEPFAGSGATVEACLLEGLRCVAIEREAEYLPLILHRIERAS